MVTVVLSFRARERSNRRIFWVSRLTPSIRYTSSSMTASRYWAGSSAACSSGRPRLPGPVSYTHLDVYKRQDLTVVIVSQRTSSIQHADQILVLDDGRQVGLGSHETLLDTCPVYREIYESQFKKGGEGA